MADTVTATTAEPAPPRGRRLVGGVLGVAVVLALGRLVFPAAPPTDVLELPPLGMVRAAQLDDGTPVFLSHAEDDSVYVIEAFTRQTGNPIGGLVGWCPAAEQFVDPHHGPQYDRRGLRYELSVPARQTRDELIVDDPGPDEDLIRRRFERLDGRGDAEDPLLVDADLDDEELQRLARPRLEGTNSLAPPESCRVPRPQVIPPARAPSAISRNRLLDHTFQATTLSLPRDRWQISDGFVLVTPDAAVTWCRVEPVGSPPSCPDIAPVTVSLDITAEDVGGGWAVIGGPLAARVQDEVVVEVATLPRSTWRGSSLRGSLRYTGTLAGYRLPQNLVELEPLDPAEHPGQCVAAVGGARRADPPAAGQYIDPHTVFDVDPRPGGEDVVDLAERAVTGVEVDVVVDVGTCRALTITRTG